MSAAIERKTSIGRMQFKDADRGEGRVRFALPDGHTPDKDRDITLPNALPEGAQVAVSPFGHTSITDGALPAGRATIHADGTADVRFFMDTPHGKATFNTLKGLGEITQYSYGFRPLELGDVTPAMRDAGVRRVLKRLDVVELSACVVGAAARSGTLALKCDGCHGEGGACSCSSGKQAPDARAAMAEYTRVQAYLKTLFPPPSDAEFARRQEKIDAAVAALSCKYGWRPAETRVDPGQHRGAVMVAAWAAAKCGIVPPAVKWFASDSPLGKTSRGLHYGDEHTIWLRSDLWGWRLVETTLHELAHSARAARALPNTEGNVEADTHELLSIYSREVC
jgi:hypothetical protein